MHLPVDESIYMWMTFMHIQVDAFPFFCAYPLSSICICIFSVVPKIFHISYTRAASPDSIYHLPLLPLPSVLFRNLRCEEEPGSQRCTSAVVASSQRFRQSALLSSAVDVTLHHIGTGRRQNIIELFQQLLGISLPRFENQPHFIRHFSQDSYILHTYTTIIVCIK